MSMESLLAAVAQAVLDYLLRETGLAERVRAVLGVDPERRAFRTALASAYAAFARQYPDLVASLFDESFLTREGTPILAQLLTRRGRPDPAELARRWARHLGYRDPESWPRLTEATRAAADFLTWLEAELAEQPVLQPLWDSRALERIAENTEAIRRALEEQWPRALAEANRYVQITGSVDRSVIITGSGNTVTQVFQTFFGDNYTPLADLYLPPDPVFDRVGLDDFVGRDWLKADLDRFLSEHERGVWLLVGEAGVGKTTFLAHLVRERRYLHFFAEQAPGEAGVRRALQSLAAQLVARYRLEPYASREALSAEQAAAPDFFERLLRMAAERLTAGERLIIVVDALDEAGTGANGNVLGLPKTLPKGVFLILSQRPAPVPLRIDPYPHVVDLQAEDARNLADIEAYLRGVARRPAIAGQLRARNYTEEKFIRVLREKSAGNWMYLHYVVQEIEQGRRHPLDLEGLPPGLAGYYAEYWGRWRRGPEWDSLYAPLLAALAAAREMVSLRMLARWAGRAADHRLRRLLEEDWAPFLFRSDDRFRLYHASLQDFLSGKMEAGDLTPADRALIREMAKRTQAMHGRIADDYLQLAREDYRRLAEEDDGYGLRHLAAHLAGAGRWEELHALVATGEERQPWAEARHAVEGHYGGYLADLALAWRRAEEEWENDATAATAMSRQVRYALIQASIHALAGNIPPALLTALVEAGRWPPAVALSYALQVPEEAQRAEALIALAPHLPPDLLEPALAAAREIKNEWDRARALAALAPHLPPHLLEPALTAAREIGDERFRAKALAALAPHLPPHLLEPALTAAREIRDEEDRARALAALAPHLPPDLRTQALTEALTAAREIGDEGSRAEALAALAPHLPPDLRTQALTEALTAAREIENEWSRARALTALAPHLPPDLLEPALTAAREIGDERFRAEALTALAPHLPSNLRTQALTEALTAAREIRDAWARAWALAALAPYLPPHLQTQALTEALTAAREIRDAWARARALAALAPHLSAWAQSQPKQAYQEARTTLHALAMLPRPAFLRDLRALMPFFLALVPEEKRVQVAAEIFYAIRDVGRWWP